MKNARKEITLFNFFSSVDDPNIYESKRTNIQGVSVFAQTQVNVSKEGLSSASVYTIRIPVESVRQLRYFRNVNFNSLADKSDAFTLAKGDKIVLGFADDESPTEESLEKKYGFDYVVTITGVTDNRDKREPHWRVIGE